MESMSLSGLATGLDTSSIIQQLMSIERRPVRMMEARKATENLRLERFRSLNTKLAALQTSAKNLVGTSFNLSPISAKKATSSNTAIFTASADNTATAGSYSVEVTQLAREQKTGGGGFTSPAAAGNIRIADSTGAFKDIAIAAGATAADVAKSINDANFGMSASVIKDGAGNDVLVLTGKQTGETYTINDGDANGDGVIDGDAFAASLGIDSATKTYQTALQAEVVVDGKFTYQSKSNAVTNAIPGVTINAVAKGTATLTIERDSQAAVDKVKDLVAKFNDIVNQIKTDTKYDSKTKQGGPLTGDSFVASLSVQLNQQLTTQFEMKQADGTFAIEDGFSYYNDIGIQVQRDGTLTLDESKLKAALDKDPNKVYALLGQEDGGFRTDANGFQVDLNTNRDGLAKRLDAFVDTYISRTSKYVETKDASGARFDGLLYNRINTSENRLEGFDDRIEAYERRLELRERVIRAQFLAMEKAVASLRNQGNYLAGQFAQMGGG